MSDKPPRPEEIEALIETFQASDCVELHLRFPGFELHLSNEGAPDVRTSDPPAVVAGAPMLSAAVGAPAVTPAAATPAPSATEGLEGLELVRAPYLGVFYRAPKPGDPPYVEVGQSVQAETDVCLVEVMKLFTAVRAGVAGRIERVLVEDGAMVEADQPLFAIAPAA